MATTSGQGVSHKTHYARIGHASQHLIPNMLKEVLAHYIPSNTIFNIVTKCYVWNGRLKPGEWAKIKDAATKGYSEFDISLIYTILRNQFPNIRPSRGWNQPGDPLSHEILLGDDIERCRRSRNQILHRGNTTVTDEELKDIFTDFTLIAGRLEVHLGKQNKEFISQFEHLRTCFMDEQTEKLYLELIEREKNTTESINSLKEKAKQTEERVSQVEQDLKGISGKKNI